MLALDLWVVLPVLTEVPDLLLVADRLDVVVSRLTLVVLPAFLFVPEPSDLRFEFVDTLLSVFEDADLLLFDPDTVVACLSFLPEYDDWYFDSPSLLVSGLEYVLT